MDRDLFRTYLIGFLSVIVAGTFLGRWLVAQDRPQEKEIVHQITHLYHLKVVAAEGELNSDKVTLEYWKKRLDRHNSLASRNLIAETQHEDTQLAYSQALVEVGMSENALEWAKVQYNLIEEGVRRGDIDLSDLVIGTDLRMKRK